MTWITTDSSRPKVTLIGSHALAEVGGFEATRTNFMRGDGHMPLQVGLCVTSLLLYGSNSTGFSARCNIYISRLCYDVSVRLSVRLSVCYVCALWPQGAMDPGYLCMLG